MAYTLRIEHKATIEMHKAYVWYEAKKDGLGDELILEFERCFEKITINPEYYSYIDKRKKFRRIKVERFPYVIMYKIKDGSIVVVFNARNTWMKPKY